MAKKAVALLLFGLFLSIPGTAFAQQTPTIEVVSQDWKVENDSTWNLTFATSTVDPDVEVDITIFAIQEGNRVPLHRFNQVPIDPEEPQTTWQLDIRSLNSSEPTRTLIPEAGNYIVGLDLRDAESVVASTETVLTVTPNGEPQNPTLALIAEGDQLESTLALLESTGSGAIVGLDITAVQQILSDESLRERANLALQDSTAFSFVKTEANVSSLTTSDLLDEFLALISDSNQSLSDSGINVLPSMTLLPSEVGLNTYQALAEAGIDRVVIEQLEDNSAFALEANPAVQIYPLQTDAQLIQGDLSLTSRAAAKLTAESLIIPLDLRDFDNVDVAAALVADFSGTALDNASALPSRDATETAELIIENSDEIATALQLALSFGSQGNNSTPIGLGYRQRLFELINDDISEPDLASLTAEITADLAQVEILSGQQLNVASTEAELPITIINNSNSTRLLTLIADSEKATIESATRQITVQPGTNLENIRVEFRSLGSTDLEISLVTPDQQVVVSNQSLPVRSTAFPFMGVGLSAVALLSLLVWWAWTAKRGKKAKSEATQNVVSLEDSERPYNGSDQGGSKADGADIDNRTGPSPSQPV